MWSVLSRLVLAVAVLCAALTLLLFLTGPSIPAAIDDPEGAVAYYTARTGEAVFPAGIVGAIALLHPLAGAVVAYVFEDGARITAVAVDPVTGESAQLPGDTLTALGAHTALIVLFALGIGYGMAWLIRHRDGTPSRMKPWMWFGLAFVIGSLATSLLGAEAPSMFGALTAVTALRAGRTRPAPVLPPEAPPAMVPEPVVVPVHPTESAVPPPPPHDTPGPA